MTSPRLVLCFGALLTGCFGNFDESLYMIDAGPMIDSGPRVGLSGELSDVCGAEAPLLTLPEGAQVFEFDVDTRGRADTAREVSSCTGRSEGGPDLFMSVDAVAGEHLHFHVDVDPFDGRVSANPAVYVLRDCDERACSVGDGLDLCDAGSDEHFTFIPTATDRYIVAFDSPAEGFEGRILAFRTICGDGRMDHSENCDDGNDVNGDGCDTSCRTELSGATPMEVEVNDDIYSANRVDVSGGVSVRASLDLTCESDVFAFDVPAMGSVRASLAGMGGADCPDELATARIELIELNARGPSVLTRGTLAAGDVCPSIRVDHPAANGLAAGTYYIAISVLRDRADTLAYEVSLSLE